MTFNHERYINAAMDGIMMQRVNFPVEVVIGDDFSTDNTLKIIKTYKSTADIHIKILERAEGDEYWHNRQKYGRLYNFFDILQNCKGKYIALLDGDDYWTDPLKLKKQVSYLENNRDCSIVFHACRRRTNEFGKNIRHHGSPKMDFNEFLIENPFVSTASVLLRSEIIPSYKPWMMSLFAGDFVMKYLSLLLGNIGYLDDIMSVYNQGTQGSWSKRELTKQVALKEYADNLRMLDYCTNTSVYDLTEGIKWKRKFLRGGTYLKLALAMPYFRGVFYLIHKIRFIGLKRLIVYFYKGRLSN